MNSIDRRLTRLLSQRPALSSGRRKRTTVQKPQIVAGMYVDRKALWGYCQRTANGSLFRAKAANVPHDITAYFIEELILDQGFRCAVSGIFMEIPKGKPKRPFCMSLDRIVPSLGYVKGNVRVVCEIANVAMNAWGTDPLERLVDAMIQKRKQNENELETPNNSRLIGQKPLAN